MTTRRPRTARVDVSRKQDSELLPEHLEALFASFLPEGAELDTAG